MPVISVIVPVYNTEKYLKRCVDSILSQTFADLELILVDDGSTDNSGNICEQYAVSDPRVKVFHQTNQGQAAARNYALDWILTNSSSEWISFVDSDDWIHPEMLEFLYRVVCENNTQISICGFIQTDHDIPTIEDKQFYVKLYNVEDFYCDNTNIWAVVPWGKLYHRNCFKEIRYPSVRACEDEFVTYKILFQFKEVPVVEATLYCYYMSNNSTMRSNWTPKRLVGIQALEERMRYLKQNHYQKAWCKTAEIYVLWGLYDQIKQIDELPNALEYKKYRSKLMCKLKIEFLRYRKVCGFYLDNYMWVYEKVYPKFMRIYWFIQGQIYKFQRLKNNVDYIRCGLERRSEVLCRKSV